VIPSGRFGDREGVSEAQLRSAGTISSPICVVAHQRRIRQECNVPPDYALFLTVDDDNWIVTNR
jgi:hypothetical protein